MKKILSLILVAAMVMSLAVMTTSAENIGSGEYAPMAPAFDEADMTQALDENQVDAQGIYYTLDAETMTAIVGKNTYSDTASADAGLTTDSIVIPEKVVFAEAEYTVVAIGRNAFDGTAVREIVFFGETIGEFAFAGCTSLETVLAFKATEIKGFAFWGCTALNIIYITDADSIGGGSFWNCSNLKNITLGASTIMEKAFEGCNLDYIVFTGDAPAVAAGAIDSAEKAYITADATGYEDFPIETEVLSANIIDIEDVYAKAGETAEVAVIAPAGANAGEISVNLNIAEGLTVTEVISGNKALCSIEVATFDAGILSGNILSTAPGVLAILKVTLPEDAAGTYAITAEAEGYTCIAGSITVCDHADTKTVTIKSASCDEAGTQNTVCTACGEVISTEEVEAKGHDYTDFVIAPTCTEGGYTRHICNCCSDAYTDAETDALGHTWDEGDVKVEASTSKGGLIVYTCTVCGTTKNVNTPKIIYGDSDNNGEVNVADGVQLLKYLTKWELEEGTFSLANSDNNGDSKVNIYDVSRLLKYLADWDVVLGPTEY